MLDDWVDGPDMIKPAMKGSESYRALWATSSEEGCTFWKNGLCELHHKELKPMHAQLSHHGNTKEQNDAIAETVRESWFTEEAEICIKNWKEKYYKGQRYDYDDEDVSSLLPW